MQKLVNGELVDLTTEEIEARQAEEAASNLDNIKRLLKARRDELASVYVLRGVPMKLHDGARADLIGLYYSVILNSSLPDATVMARWQEQGYDTLLLTAGDLRTHGALMLQSRQAGFTAYDLTKEESFATPELALAAIQSAFDAEMEG